MSGRYFIGFILLILGIGYLLEQVGVIGSFGALLSIWWPVLVVLLGINMLIRHPVRPWGSLIVTLVGVFLVLSNLRLLPHNLWPLIGALLLIAIGVRLLVPRRKHRRDVPTVTTQEREVLHEQLSFGALHYHNTSQHFQGGQVHVSFAEYELDLRGAQLAPGGADLDIDASFGGVQVRVPEQWPVVTMGNPSFGTCNTHVRRVGTGETTEPVLRIKCAVSFGSVEITN